MTDRRTLEWLFRNYEPGDGGSWRREFDWIQDYHGAQLVELCASIRENGIQTPIALGKDGRVWDGHHRLVAAVLLGMETVPVSY